MRTPALRPYQSRMSADIDHAWALGFRNVLAVLPTGAGKTVTFSEKLKNTVGACCAVAHRQELVGQISLSLARFGLRHRIIAPRPVIKLILEQQGDELGRTFYDPNAAAAVAGIDTLIRRVDDLERWRAQVVRWVMDEAHHVLKANKWGKGVDLFPNAFGLGVTASPERADGRGLGRDSDGLFDSLICGPTMRDLIAMGFLSDFRIFAPPSDLDLTPVRTQNDGEFNRGDVKEAVRKSHIVGDVVAHYLRIAPGKLGVTFAVDVEESNAIADRFRAAGVPAVAVDANTPDKDRARIIADFKARRVLQLVNVDLFGEGFDVPGIEVVSMARPTQSLAVFMQQFGRALRILAGKTHGIIIDHVGNVQRHTLRFVSRDNWSLAARERATRGRRDPDAIPVTSCTNPACGLTYEAINRACPFCGHVPEPAGRSRPEQVMGDLCELDPAALAALGAEVARIDGPPIVPYGAHRGIQKTVENNWIERQEAQRSLRQSIAQWAGFRRAEGMQDSEIYRRFYFAFGTDVMTAQTLGRPDATELTARVYDAIFRGAVS